jgi:hypothetical protein
LWEYRQRPLGRQPFYAFPRPDWAGNLKEVALANGRIVTELAFLRSGRKWWFADWMVVLPAADVAAVLQPELAAHNSRKRGSRKRLVEFDPADPMNPTWGPANSVGADPKGLIGWLDFWAELDRCGRADWPQLIRLPARILPSRASLQHSEVAQLLQEAESMLIDQWNDNERLVTLEPDADGSYQVARDVDDQVARGRTGEPDEDRPNESDDHRQIVFVNARALRRR